MQGQFTIIKAIAGHICQDTVNLKLDRRFLKNSSANMTAQPKSQINPKKPLELNKLTMKISIHANCRPQTCIHHALMYRALTLIQRVPPAKFHDTLYCFHHATPECPSRTKPIALARAIRNPGHKVKPVQTNSFRKWDYIHPVLPFTASCRMGHALSKVVPRKLFPSWAVSISWWQWPVPGLDRVQGLLCFSCLSHGWSTR